MILEKPTVQPAITEQGSLSCMRLSCYCLDNNSAIYFFYISLWFSTQMLTEKSLINDFSRMEKGAQKFAEKSSIWKHWQLSWTIQHQLKENMSNAGTPLLKGVVSMYHQPPVIPGLDLAIFDKLGGWRYVISPYYL